MILALLLDRKRSGIREEKEEKWPRKKVFGEFSHTELRID